MELRVKCVGQAKETIGDKTTVYAEKNALFELYGKSDQAILEEGDRENIYKILNWTGKETIKWTLLDEDKEKVVDEKTCTSFDKYTLSVPKKLSGDYCYYLKAAAPASPSLDGLYVNGYCESKILKTSIESDAGGAVSFGNIITVLSEAEGLNGNNIKVEIYNEKDICMANLDTKCREGDIRREGFDTLGWQSKCKDPEVKKEPKEYKFRIRIKNGNEYVLNVKNKIDVFEFKIKNETVTPKTAVENKMITTINDHKNQLALEPQTAGILVLESALVETDYTVTNDYVKNKKRDHWIWKDGNGKDCHWAKAEYREIITDENLKAETDKVRKKIKNNIKNNRCKPKTIPVMLPSTKDFKITTWFKVIIPFDTVSIRLTDINQKKDRNGQGIKYIYDDQISNDGKKDSLFKLEYKSILNPYKNQVQYFKKFQLLPEYSLDGKTWTPMETIFFEFYIIWKLPVNFGGKEIQETILRLGCEYNENQTEEEKIVEGVFAGFNQKDADGVPRVFRVREVLDHTNRPDGEPYLKKVFVDSSGGKETGMGYWRGASSATDGFKSIGGRTNDVLLEYGEARCGEWRNLFLKVLNLHGIDTCESIAICTDNAKEGTYANLFIMYTHKTENKEDKIKSQEFAVKDYAFFMDPATNVLMQNGLKSIGQGNSDAQPRFMDHVWCYYPKNKKFYDPSYAAICEASISTYCKDNLTSIHVKDEKKDDVKISDIHDYIWADKEKLF